VLLDVEQLLRLWTDPLPEDDDAAAEAFRHLYADPVTVNGTQLTARDMAARARSMQTALAEPEHEVLAAVESGDAVAVVFRLAGRHVGVLDTPLGPLPASGARIDLRVIDVLRVTDGRISAIWMVGDWLGALAAAGLVQVALSEAYAVELSATFPLPPERLWSALVEPAELVRWWGPHGFTTSEPQIDTRPGGRYRLTMRPPTGEAFHVTGEYREVDPPARLAYTFRYEEPAPDDRETVVSLRLAAVDGGTVLSLSHGPFATEERRQLHRAGWTESFERLRASLSARAVVQ
jgi:uncharacterized protein YndB with AHSA1/START domain/predicted ester cyclase